MTRALWIPNCFPISPLVTNVTSLLLELETRQDNNKTCHQNIACFPYVSFIFSLFFWLYSLFWETSVHSSEFSSWVTILVYWFPQKMHLRSFKTNSRPGTVSANMPFLTLVSGLLYAPVFFARTRIMCWSHMCSFASFLIVCLWTIQEIMSFL